MKNWGDKSISAPPGVNVRGDVPSSRDFAIIDFRW